MGVSFKEAVRSNRWTTESIKKEHILVEGDHLNVVNVTPTSETDLLKRCIVGKFQSTSQEIPTLNDVRRWACNTWKSAIGVSIFAMNDGHFLFELPTRVAAEHVMAGTWGWKKMNLNLEWWSPTTGCWPEHIARDWVWIRVLGLP